MPISKSKLATTGQISKHEQHPQLCFSFRYFDPFDQELCPQTFQKGYTQALMNRLRDLSAWTVRQFEMSKDRTLRIHKHDWSQTSRPHGFKHLPDHYRVYPGWQFCISLSKHGRVHGILVDNTFHVIWLDHHHALYPGEK